MSLIAEVPYEFSPKEKETVKNYAYYKKSVLFLDHAFLKKIKVTKTFDTYLVNLYFDDLKKKSPKFVIESLKKRDLEDLINTIKNMVVNLKIINDYFLEFS